MASPLRVAQEGTWGCDALCGQRWSQRGDRQQGLSHLPHGGQGRAPGAHYQLQDGQVTLPPQVPAHPWSQAGQGVVAIHEDVDKGVEHPNKEG